ncbi:putative glycosyltransferase EpsJ [compost metagenome]
MNNLISILIPTYNRAHLIGETLNSLLGQTYRNWECIVVDDGSTDNTEEVLKKYSENDLRFKYYRRPEYKTKGANACRNYGFELSAGEFIKWFDSDDIMCPDFLKKQIEVLVNQPELDFCASFSETFVERIENVVEYNNPNVYLDNQDSLFNYLIGELVFFTPSPLWRRDFLENKNLFDETLFNAHETDFNFERLKEGAKFKYLTEVLFLVRRGHESIDRNSRNNINSFSSILKYYQKVFLYLKNESAFLDKIERKILLKFILYKQLMLTHSLRQNLSVIDFGKEIKKVFPNIFGAKLELRTITKILLGVILMAFFKKGYRFFDLKELKVAKHYK